MGMTTGIYNFSNSGDVHVNTGLVAIKSVTVIKTPIGGGGTNTAYTSDAYQLAEALNAYTLDGNKEKGLRLNGPEFIVELGCAINKSGYRYIWEAREP